MNKELIETIAKLVLEQIREASVEKAAITESKASSSGMVKLWDHLSSTPQFVETGMKQQADSVPAQNHEKPVKLWDHVGNSKESIPRCSMNNEDLILPELQTRIGVSSPNKPDALQ